MSDLLTRDQILAAEDLPSEIVAVPEWGGSVRVRGLTGAERDRFESSIVEFKGRKVQRVQLENFRARLVFLTVVDAEGKRLFTSKNDVARLGEKSAAALARVFNKAQELSGITPADIEELTKN